MKKLLILLLVGGALSACQSAKKPEMAAAEPAVIDSNGAVPAADAKVAMADKAAVSPMVGKDAKFPVKTKGGLSFGDKHSIPNKCLVPPEGKQKGEPLSDAMIAAWPQQFFADVSIMKAALAGVAYPEEVAYIQNCMEAKVLEQQVPGPLPAAA